MDDTQELGGELAALRRRIGELEARLEADMSADPQPTATATRRGLLRLAGAAVVGGAAAAVSATPAAAGTGTMTYGTSMNSGSDETSITSVSQLWTFQATNTSSIAGAAIRGIGTAGAFGIYGRNDDTSDPTAGGVFGGSAGTQGYGVVAGGGKAQLFLQSNPNMGPSSTGTQHSVGEIAYDDDTNGLWVCVASGSTGTWRKLGGAATAGSLHVIAPARAYDSRQTSPGPKSTLATGANRLVSVANKYNVSTGALVTSNVVPSGATAIAYNLTVVNTVGTNGFLAVNDGGNTTVAASIINWTAPGQTIANSSVVKLNGSRQITVICGGTSTSCNFIIDVLGYYL
jgi:hypothetical protein